MRARRLLTVLGLAVVLAGCGGVPKVNPNSSDTATPTAVATIGPGTVMGDALTEAHCVRAPNGAWTANGVLKNTTKQTRSFDVNIYVGPADGDPGVAPVLSLNKLAAGAPFGPVRVDIAHGLNNPDSQFQLYLNIGADL